MSTAAITHGPDQRLMRPQAAVLEPLMDHYFRHGDRGLAPAAAEPSLLIGVHSGGR